MPTLALDGGVLVDVTIQNPPAVTLVQGNVASAEIFVAGPQGPKGNRGTLWYSGVGAPAGTLGVIQDWYLNTDNGDTYEKTAEFTWTLRDNLTGSAATDTAQTWTRPQTFAMALGADVALTVRSHVDATADLQRWQNSAGTTLSRIAADGQIFEGANRVYSAANANLATTLPLAETFGHAGAIGTGTFFARNDHIHPMPATPVTSALAGTGIAVSGATGAVTFSNTGVITVAGRAGAVTLAAADVAGVYYSGNPNLATTVVSDTAFGQAAGVGIGTLYARNDHTHGTPPTPVTSLLAGAGITVSASTGAVTVTNSGYHSGNANLATTVVSSTIFGQASVVGIDTLYARADHAHGTPATPVTSAVAGVGIGVSGSTGAVTFTNTGVTSIVAGTNVTISGATGAVTVNAPSPATMMTTDTAQTITGQKTWSTSSTLTVNGVFKAILSQTADITQWQDSAGGVMARVAANGHIFEGANRVYSAGNPPPATDLSNYVTLDSAQTISATKTFTAIPVVPDASFAVAKLSATGVKDATTFLRGDNTWATINISNMVTTDTAQTITAVKTFTLTPVVPDASFGVAKLSATGVKDTTTFLRGDNTWATINISNMATTDTVQTITATKTFLASAATAIPLISQGAAAQTADLQQWRDNAGNILARVANDGTIYKGGQAVGGNAADTEIMAIMGAF